MRNQLSVALMSRRTNSALLARLLERPNQPRERERKREMDRSPAGLVTPGLPVIRKTVLHKPLFRENAVCSPTSVFP